MLLSAGWKRVPSSVDLAMALQLSREQGITLRGSAEIVAEFFCKSSRRPQGGENGAQAARQARGSASEAGGSRVGRSGPEPKPSQPRPPARQEESGKRRMQAPPPDALLMMAEDA